MKAVGVFPAAREVRIVEHREPVICSPRQIKMRMLEVGVCGTDRDLCAFHFGSAPDGSDHFVLGHESLAEILEVGPEVTAVRPGDLAVAVVRMPCNSDACAPCRSGRQDFCATGAYRERGIQSMHGFMTEMVVEDERYIYALPQDLREIGVLIEPLTIAEKAFLEFRAIDDRLPWSKERRTALVLGAGPVGLLGAMLFRHAGFETWIYSRSRAPNPKADIAAAIGVRYVSSNDVEPRALAATTGNIDVVYEALGAAQTAFDVLECLGPNGVFLFTGVPSRTEPLRLNLHRLMLRMIMKNQVVAGTVNAGPDAFEAAIRDLAAFHRQWPRAVRSIVTGRYPIEGYRDAIFGRGGIKNVITL
jgi:threonine dehydrogenase-like Zn-dependent dehydrogenase